MFDRGPIFEGSYERVLHHALGVETRLGQVIGAGGAEKVVEIKLGDEAKANLQVSVDAVKELLVACKGIDSSLG